MSDGIDHINVYSKGKTELGKMLSNFYHSSFTCEDGKFESVEGYWYWLSTKDDKLRTLYGFEAKRYGRSINGKDWLEDESFKKKIKQAIKAKVTQSNIKNLLKESTLPFKHYYLAKNEFKIEVPKSDWIIQYLEDLRKELKENND